MNLSKFLHTTTGKYLMSIILGMGLATFFREICKGNNCKIIKAPPLEEIDDKIYKFDDKCYKIERNAVKCDKNKNILHF